MKYTSKLTSTKEGSRYLLGIELSKEELERCYTESVSLGYGGDFTTFKGVMLAGKKYGILVELSLLRMFLANAEEITKPKIIKKRVIKKNVANIRRRQKG